MINYINERQVREAIKNELMQSVGTDKGFKCKKNEKQLFDVTYIGQSQLDQVNYNMFKYKLSLINREREFRLKCEDNRLCYLNYVIDPSTITDYGLEDWVIDSYIDNDYDEPETVYTLQFDLNFDTVEELEHLIYKITDSDEDLEELISFTNPCIERARWK